MHRINNPRLLLTRLRDGDYAHAGDIAAIDIVLDTMNRLLSAEKGKLTHSKSLKALDVGCGLGGTADYIREKTGFNMYGIDLDNAAIKHAKLHHPMVNVSECDVLNVDKLFVGDLFEVFFMFNVFYIFSNKDAVLKTLANIAKPNSLLIIFDYTQAKGHKINLKDLAGKPMYPIYIDATVKSLNETGWELIEISDISDKYDKWYSDFLDRLKIEKEHLLKEFTEQSYDIVLTTFSFLLAGIKNREIGGGIIYARYCGAG
jgi:SAM-dependent methyltransferase